MFCWVYYMKPFWLKLLKRPQARLVVLEDVRLRRQLGQREY